MLAALALRVRVAGGRGPGRAPLRRAALAAPGLWWALLAEPLSGRPLLLGARRAQPATARASVSMPRVSPRGVWRAAGAAWAAAALVLPLLVRGRTSPSTSSRVSLGGRARGRDPAVAGAASPPRCAPQGAGAGAAGGLLALRRGGACARRRRSFPSMGRRGRPPRDLRRHQMSVLRNLETKLADLVEGGFGRMFRAEVRPVELARRLAKEMDEHRTVSLARTYAPNEYVVHLSPRDRERYAGVEREVCDELSRVPARARPRRAASRSPAAR